MDSCPAPLLQFSDGVEADPHITMEAVSGLSHSRPDTRGVAEAETKYLMLPATVEAD